MKIVLARIDNRLLHGITATQWVPKLGVDRVMVIDDEIAHDVLSKDSMRLAKPAGVALSIISQEDAIGNFKLGKYDLQRIFIIVKSVNTLKSLIEAGVKVDAVNIGATVERPSEKSVGRYPLSRFATCSLDEATIYNEFIKKGIQVFIAYTTQEVKNDFSNIYKGEKHDA